MLGIVVLVVGQTSWLKVSILAYPFTVATRGNKTHVLMYMMITPAIITQPVTEKR